MEEEVPDKYEVEESKREAFRGRGTPLEWRRVRKNKKYIQKVVRRLLGENFPFLKEYKLQRVRCEQEESTEEEEEMKQQQRMVFMSDQIWKIRSRGRMDAKSY